MPAFRTSAIVLNAYDFSEADRVMVLFTREEGKIRALAKGVRRSRSRLAGCLGLLTLSELQLHGKENQELLLVTQGQLETAFPGLKVDLEALGQAGRMAELIDRMIPERQSQAPVFDLLLAGLRLLEEKQRPAVVGIWFEISLLELLGYRPRLDSCHVCSQEKERGLPGLWSGGAFAFTRHAASARTLSGYGPGKNPFPPAAPPD
jgi:DNA repair protein RecO (recombination protein O)